MLRKSGFDGEAMSKDLLDLSSAPLGQNCPRHCPHLERAIC